MGINKPDVRYVIHYDLPDSLENYYQETGRGGRDGLDSDCILFYSRGDRAKIEYFISEISSGVQKKTAVKKLDAMTDFCESKECRVRMLLDYFGEKTEGFACGTCDNCLHPSEEFDGTDIAVLAVLESYGDSISIKDIRILTDGKIPYDEIRFVVAHKAAKNAKILKID